MVKLVTLIKRKPGLSREEFIKYHGEEHAPQVVKHLPMIKKYVRNYISKNIIVPPGVQEPEFDCIVEVWYESMQDFQAAIDTVKSHPEIRDAEGAFIDSSKITTFMVEEIVSK